jgi:cytidylate kinase
MNKPSFRKVRSMVDEQCHRWASLPAVAATAGPCPVVTISRQPGTNGRAVAVRLAEELGAQVFGSNIIDQVARSARISRQAVEFLDERGHGFVDNLLASLPGSGGMTDQEYIKHLAEILVTIGQYGDAVILGRGANFVLPLGQALRVRFVAGLETRLTHVMDEFDLGEAPARRQMKAVASNRRRFVRLYFDADIADPSHYDLIINDDHLGVEQAVAIIAAAVEARR